MSSILNTVGRFEEASNMAHVNRSRFSSRVIVITNLVRDYFGSKILLQWVSQYTTPAQIYESIDKKNTHQISAVNFWKPFPKV